jgi:hypothetical protein
VGGRRPTSIAVNVSVSNGASWSSEDTCSFFDAAPTSGPAGGSHTLTPSAGWDLLPAGSYQCPITYSASGNSNLTVQVTAVKEAVGSAPAAPTNLRVE